MKTLSMTVFNRPDYLERTLESLSKNDLRNYDLFYIGIEPVNEKCFKIVEQINFIPTEIILNERVLGVRRNPFNLLSKLFDEGSEFNVYLEDDVLLSPDAFMLADFHYSHFKNKEDTYLLCSFYNYLNKELFEKSKVFAYDNMVSIGFSLFRESWEKWIKPYWFDDNISRAVKIKGLGWDWSLRAVMKKFKLKTLSPCLPRSFHIGEKGTFCNPKVQAKIFTNKEWCTENLGNFYFADGEDIMSMQIIQNCLDLKIYDVLKDNENCRALIMFNHGIGDTILFLPIFEELNKLFPNCKIQLGCYPEKNYKFLHEKVKVVDAPFGKYAEEYDFIFDIQYMDVPRNQVLINYYKNNGIADIEAMAKPELCNLLEVGISNFKWTNFKLDINISMMYPNPKLVGLHFFGHSDKIDKDCPIETAERIWNEVKEAGFIPFEMQMIPVSLIGTMELPHFISEEETLRFTFPNIRILCENIAKCSKFIGVDSGPLFLAGSILDYKNCIGLEYKRELFKVVPFSTNLKKVDIFNYIPGTVAKILKG